jgi:hypothetical protein
VIRRAAAAGAVRARAVALWGALAAGQVLLAAALLLFGSRVPAERSPAAAAVVGILALAAAGLSFVVPARMRTEAPPEATALVRSVVAAAMAEAGAMIALVGWLVARGPALLAVAAAAFAAFLVHFPGRGRFARMG